VTIVEEEFKVLGHQCFQDVFRIPEQHILDHTVELVDFC